MYKVIIIGGGFSGLVSGIKLAEKFGGKNVLILEKLDRVGKKILATGNGRCNITNENLKEENYHGKNVGFVNYAITCYDNNALKDFFKKLGLLFSVEENKVYPLSLQASSVLDVLRLRLYKLGCNIISEAEVMDVYRDNGFCVTTKNGKFHSENIVVATGGKSQKQFGTDGSFFEIVKKLGHNVTPLYPSIVQLKCDVKLIRGLKGIKQNAIVKLIKNNKCLYRTEGDLLFTEYGISGDSVFRLSSYVNYDEENLLEIEFLPNVSRDELSSALQYKINNIDGISAEELLIGIINKQFGRNILSRLGIPFDSPANKMDLNLLVNQIKSYKLKITGSLGFDYSQVTRGGVSTDEINDKSMESRLIDKMYFVGEVLDIDGDCGGYNLQWAFSSACVCADCVE